MPIPFRLDYVIAQVGKEASDPSRREPSGSVSDAEAAKRGLSTRRKLADSALCAKGSVVDITA